MKEKRSKTWGLDPFHTGKEVGHERLIVHKLSNIWKAQQCFNKSDVLVVAV